MMMMTLDNHINLCATSCYQDDDSADADADSI